MTDKAKDILSFLDKYYHEAKCSLDFNNAYECLVAVCLSAQTSDASVNRITPTLFSLAPNPKGLYELDLAILEKTISSLGLYKNKSRNLHELAKALVEKYHGEVPLDFIELRTLPGVGIKTANVVLCEIAKRPAIAVDTHVSRISKRLRFAKEDDSPEIIEKKLEKIFPKEEWINLHHRIIHFGRDICKAKNPECHRCELHKYCKYYKSLSMTIGK